MFNIVFITMFVPYKTIYMKNRNLKNSDDWMTPPKFYEILNERFNFDFDPCPYKHDIKKWDGLEIEWKKSNYINPPYSRELKEKFINKAIEESKKGKLCVLYNFINYDVK